MRHFVQIATGVDVLPLLLAVKRHPGLWNQHPFRTQPAQSPHREVSDIIVYSQLPDATDARECVPYPAWQALPQVRPHVFALMARLEAVRLGRVLITRLGPGCQIYPHRDYGAREDGYADWESYWDRLHVCLDADEGSLFCCGDEQVIMHPGDVWWFDGGEMHSVVNDGQRDRLHLIVDVRLSEPRYA